MNKQFTLGCDPELFLQDASGALRSAIGLIGGSKYDPRPLPIGPGYAVQEDNVALEYNIPPARNMDEFDTAINNAMSFLANQVREYGLAFSQSSAAFFPPEQLMHPQAMEFGCDPDFNAWTKKENPRPKATDATLRSCGGHVHIGADIYDKWELGRLCDLYLGVPATLMDKGDLRKKLYGKAGAVRIKPYGLEYRVLSNFWIFDKRYRQWVWNNTALALNAEHIRVDEEQELILDAINNNNASAARHLVEKYDIPMVM